MSELALAYKLSHEQVAEFTRAAADAGASAPTDAYVAENAHNVFVAVPVVTTLEDMMLMGIVALGSAALPQDMTAEAFLALVDGSRRSRALGHRESLLVFLEMPQSALDGLAQTAVPADKAREICVLGLEYLADEIERVEPEAIETIAKMRRMAAEL
jgi:phosphoribosylcarboxyaminoimidazole (NCAIR) mutase